jgi:hypothetical protein
MLMRPRRAAITRPFVASYAKSRGANKRSRR